MVVRLSALRAGRLSPQEIHLVHFYCCTLKGKAAPRQAWSRPEDSRKLRFPDLITTAQDGGKVVSLTRRPPLPPGNYLVLISTVVLYHTQ